MKRINQKAQWTIKNNKNGKTYQYDTWEVDKYWHEPYPINFAEYNQTKDDYEAFLNEFDDEEGKQEYIKEWNDNFHNIYDDEKEYLTALVEHEVWTSPRGIESVWKVQEVQND